MGKAVSIILFGTMAFAFQGIVIRFLGTDYSLFQIAAFRNIFGFVPILIFLSYAESLATIKICLDRKGTIICLIRALLVNSAQLCLYIGYLNLEFATASTLLLVSPFFVTALSFPILGARVGLWRWFAVFLGFSGIIMIMQPTQDIFSVFALMPVLAALGYASSSLLVRKFPPSLPSAMIQLHTQAYSALISILLLSVFSESSPVAFGIDLALFAALGCFGGIGVLCLIISYRMVQPSKLAPFEYFGMPFSLLLGWYFFDEIPFDRLFPGAFSIIAGGIIIIWRERNLDRSE